jgi:Transposase DDE domain
MSTKTRRPRWRCGPCSFVSCLRQFLTPQVWKQAHQAAGPSKRRDTRWTLQPLLLTLLVMTWCAGDSQPERFETARAFYVALTPKRRRPGQTIQGFQQALERLPLFVLRAWAAAVRQQLQTVFGDTLMVDGFIPLGCDGSRLRCPRTAELEQRLGQAAQPETPPQVWLTALVHLRLGLLWSWWLGKGDASERQHLQRLADTLPAHALVVADAGYQGYDLVQALLQAGVQFLIRVSTQTTLYTVAGLPAACWTEGLVYWWTQDARKNGQPPLLLRLLRVRSPQRQIDVWLVTNVLAAGNLSLSTAAKFYKMRWENEGFFRTYKRTLAKVKLQSRTVRLVHREVFGSLLAVQLLLAQGAWAVVVLARQESAVSSPRGVLREIRQEIQGRLGVRQRQRYGQRLAQAQRERRQRSSSKVKRPWPGRQDHKPPKPPKIREMTTVNNRREGKIRRSGVQT